MRPKVPLQVGHVPAMGQLLAEVVFLTTDQEGDKSLAGLAKSQTMGLRTKSIGY